MIFMDKICNCSGHLWHFFKHFSVIMLDPKPKSKKGRRKGVKRPCTNCGKRVFDLLYSEHLLKCMVNGPEKFHCKVNGCKSEFHSQKKLSIHAEIHKPPMKCPEEGCNATFKPNYLGAHIRRVHNKVGKICPNCGKKVSCYSIGQHMKICTNNGQEWHFLCTVEGCNLGFVTDMCRNRHIRYKHGREIPRPVKNCDDHIEFYCLSQHIKEKHIWSSVSTYVNIFWE